jgi:serine/threonine-protein kinase
MTPERWKQVDQLLQEALEREPAERGAFLAEACGAADDLRREVESLLVFHNRAESFIETPPALMAGALLAENESRTGQTIGHYEIICRIGRGGMGEVYLALDVRLGREVALKLLPPRFTEHRQRIQRFRQEARAASTLNHPNIIVIYEIGEADTESGSVHFIATEFIEGRTLGALIRSGKVKLGEALEVTMQVASALSAAHAAGIVHRDIKPENIMLRPDGYVKVLDFGLAKLDEHQARDHARSGEVETDPGTVLGTVRYMSPEQARGLETDARSDIFSLGVVFYEMITGRRPFEGKTTADVITSLLGKEPPPVTEDTSPATGRLQRLVDRMLAKDRAGRFQTAEELRRALKMLKQELGTPGDYSMREFNSLARLGRRLGFAGDVAMMGAAESPAPTTSGVSIVFGWFARSPLRKAIALAALALALIGVILGWRWLDQRGAPVNSIAVLPFVNVENDPQMEYLPDGITESLIRSLSKLPKLKVTASNTIFTYKDRQVDPRQVGKSLQVRAVLIGRVQRQGERLVISVELVDAADGSLLWGERYQRPLTDILVVQEEIAREITVGLRLRLSGDEQRRLAKRYTENHAAYQLYIKGHYFHMQSTRESLQKALDLFNQASALDPRYALAYTGVADVYAELSGQYLPPNQAMPLAKQAALTAIALDDALPEAHNALAVIKWWGEWDWVGAEREFQRALALDANFPIALAHYAQFLAYQERFDEALRAARQAVDLDPFSAHSNNKLTSVLLFARRYDLAIEQCRETIDLNPSGAWVSWAHAGLGRTLSYLNRHGEAIAELEEAARLNRHDATLSFLGYAYAAAGRRDQAWQILRELKTQATSRRVSPIYIARIYVGLGDREQALGWLRKGYDEHSDHALTLRVEPIYDSLRSDPRFSAMLRGIGLAP